MNTRLSKFLIVAYPELTEDDFEKIENFRKQNDRQFNLIRPHFTLVFPVADINVVETVEEIRRQVKGIESISFTLHQAVVYKDSFDDQHRVFLVPTEGYHEIVRLHEKIYSTRLREYFKNEFAYIPHITIGNSFDKQHAEEIRDEWNIGKKPMHGKMTVVHIIQYENETISTIEIIRLI